MRYSRDDLYPRLLAHLAAHPDRRGWVHIPCPSCGKLPKRGQTHFAFGERYGHCFVCGYSTGLGRLASAVGLERAEDWHLAPRRVSPPSPQVQTARHYPWQEDPDIWRTFRPLPTVALDYYHRRGFADATIDEWRLGYGVLPSSQCHHERAILPVFERGRLVGIRGRALAADDLHAKWLCSGGSKTSLFGCDRLAPGGTVIVTEAPYSAILATQTYPDVVAVAGTGGAGCWRDEWTESLAAARPGELLVWYDCDEAGTTNGTKVANLLARARLPVHLFRWPAGTPQNCDLADLITAAERRSGAS